MTKEEMAKRLMCLEKQLNTLTKAHNEAILSILYGCQREMGTGYVQQIADQCIIPEESRGEA